MEFDSYLRERARQGRDLIMSLGAAAVAGGNLGIDAGLLQTAPEMGVYTSVISSPMIVIALTVSIERYNQAITRA